MPRKGEIRSLFEGFAKRGMTRREFSGKCGIPVTTLDYWRRQVRAKVRLVKVELARPEAAGFTLAAPQWASDRGLLRVRRRRSGPAHRDCRTRVISGVGPATKIYLAVEAVDTRKGFEGLYGLVRNPLSGHLFLFTNKTRKRLKAPVWDGSGLWVRGKRLEKGRFGWPEAEGRYSVTMRPEELAILVNGLDLRQPGSATVIAERVKISRVLLETRLE